MTAAKIALRKTRLRVLDDAGVVTISHRLAGDADALRLDSPEMEIGATPHV
ncbi:MAG: hypothetical protein ACE37J_11900 [Pikeienuella sp.]|uniref:hypothetical protein n=1 Tax=Pikeienuella sp. TaxID=2831957 RepID=UPI00391CE30C